MTTKDLDNLIIRLQKYQDWRRGIDEDFDPDPKIIGKDIDAAISVLLIVSSLTRNTSEAEFEDFEKVESVLDEDDGNHFF